MISIAITVCNEHKELETLLDYLQERALSPDYEIIIQIDEQNHTPEVLHIIIDRGIKHHFFPLNKNFAAYKNELIKHCSGEYIFQVDADEIRPPKPPIQEDHTAPMWKPPQKLCPPQVCQKPTKQCLWKTANKNQGLKLGSLVDRKNDQFSWVKLYWVNNSSEMKSVGNFSTQNR